MPQAVTEHADVAEQDRSADRIPEMSKGEPPRRQDAKAIELARSAISSRGRSPTQHSHFAKELLIHFNVACIKDGLPRIV
jgi:hypothetical protein